MHREKREVEWPPPRRDPEREPSHPGADSETPRDWWQQWKEQRGEWWEKWRREHGPDA
jgi:hypothetical protein